MVRFKGERRLAHAIETLLVALGAEDPFRDA